VLRLLFLAFDAFLNIVLPLPPAPKPTSVTTQPRPTPPRRDGMQPGSEVVVLDDPWRWGVGRIDSVGVDGKVRVKFKSDARPTLFESFDPFNLELFERFLEQDGTLTQSELRRLATPRHEEAGMTAPAPADALPHHRRRPAVGVRERLRDAEPHAWEVGGQDNV
jgi:hypothetical protein